MVVLFYVQHRAHGSWVKQKVRKLPQTLPSWPDLRLPGLRWLSESRNLYGADTYEQHLSPEKGNLTPRRVLLSIWKGGVAEETGRPPQGGGAWSGAWL